MRAGLIAAFVAVFFAVSAQAAPKHSPKHPIAAPLKSPLAPTVKPGFLSPNFADPAQVVVFRPDMLAPLGAGTVATTPSINLARDQPPILTNNLPTASGGLNVYAPVIAASDNHATIAAGQHQVYKIRVTVTSVLAADQFIRLYNAGAGFNGCNSSSGLIYRGVIKANIGLNDDWVLGMGGFSNGIAVCITGAFGDTDGTAATTNVMDVIVGWM